MFRSNWVLDPGKFLTPEEAKRLHETARRRAKAATAHGHKVAVRDYFILDLALSTGLRVMEIAQLKCGDVFLRGPVCLLLVRNGKGGKKRIVRFNGSFKRHYEEYMLWKQTAGEPIDSADPRQALVNNFGRRFHKLRRAAHVAQCVLHDLRRSCITNWAHILPIHVVQKLAGHSDIKTTQKYYLAVRQEDMDRARILQSKILANELTDPLLLSIGVK